MKEQVNLIGTSQVSLSLNVYLIVLFCDVFSYSNFTSLFKITFSSRQARVKGYVDPNHFVIFAEQKNL